MLTIRKPIELKTQRQMQSIRADLAERLTANYALMRMPIRKEELLHITSEPAEVYFAEGDQIQLFSSVQQKNQQNLRLDVINNLVNRILVAQTENFSYQDTVYISSVLRRLGIRDEKSFMKQVFALQNEHRQTRQLLQNYETNEALLQQLFAAERAQAPLEGKAPAKESAAEQRYYLHDAIFRRLETGKIYQDMRSFSQDTRQLTNQIFRAEMRIGEQAALVQNFHLHALKQKILGSAAPLYYYHNNPYEFWTENLEELHQTLEEQISAAILLNLTDQSYALRQQQIAENRHYWYSLAGALFQTAENTWKRYETNLIEQKQSSAQMLQLLEEVNLTKRQENDTIRQITEEYHALAQQFGGESNIRQSFSAQYHPAGDRTEIHLSGGSYHLTQEELQLQYLQQQSEEEPAEDSLAHITATELQRQLTQFQQKNFENYQKLTEIEQQQMPKKERKPNRKRAQQDALRALEHPQEVLREYMTTEIRDPLREAQRQKEAQIYALFSEETKEIYRQFLQQHPAGDTTFLQHIMAQPAESPLRDEVENVLRQVEAQEHTEQIERRIERQTELRQPVISEQIRQELTQHIHSLQNLQNITLYQQWTQPTQLFWRQEAQTDAAEALPFAMQEREGETILREQTRILRETERALPQKAAEIVQQETLLHPIVRTETEEIQQMETAHTIRTAQAEQLTEMRESIEKRIQRQQLEQLTEWTTTQQAQHFREIALVHKTQEQLVDEKFLESIRNRQQTTRRETHIEEHLQQQETIRQTVLQDAVNRIQTNQTENLEELVQQSVRRQLGNLSEQVYGKIEKKLTSERKRRGFF